MAVLTVWLFTEVVRACDGKCLSILPAGEMCKEARDEATSEHIRLTVTQAQGDESKCVSIGDNKPVFQEKMKQLIIQGQWLLLPSFPQPAFSSAVERRPRQHT